MTRSIEMLSQVTSNLIFISSNFWFQITDHIHNFKIFFSKLLSQIINSIIIIRNVESGQFILTNGFSFHLYSKTWPQMIMKVKNIVNSTLIFFKRHYWLFSFVPLVPISFYVVHKNILCSRYQTYTLFLLGLLHWTKWVRLE